MLIYMNEKKFTILNIVNENMKNNNKKIKNNFL